MDLIRLHLFRHGTAEPQQYGGPDEARKLSPRGIKELVDSGPTIKAIVGATPLRLYTSPLTRALQTSDIIAQALELPSSSIQILDSLAIDSDLDETVLDLRDILLDESISALICVSHEPHVTMLAHFFAPADSSIPSFGCGCMAQIDISRALGRHAGVRAKYFRIEELISGGGASD